MVNSKRKSRKRFLRGLRVYICVSLALIAVGMVVLWNGLKKYEANTPESSMRRYLSQAQSGALDALYEASGFQPTQFAGKAEYEAWLKALYGNGVQDPLFVRDASSDVKAPVYTVKSGGQAVSQLELSAAPARAKYKWNVRTRVQTMGPVAIMAPESAAVSVNGSPLDQSYVVGSQEPVGFEGLGLAKQVRYQVEGLLTTPVITAASQSGESYTVGGPASDGSYAVETVVSDENAQKYWSLTEDAAKTYAAFITQDASRAKLNTHLLKGTTFYKAMQEFYNGWYIDHDSYEYRNIQHEALDVPAPGAFSAKISFDYVILKGSKEYLYPSSYTLDFVYRDKAWKVSQILTR